jgi:hypothetical protein
MPWWPHVIPNPYPSHIIVTAIYLGPCRDQFPLTSFQPKGWNTGLSKSGHVPRGTRGHPTPRRAKCPLCSVSAQSLLEVRTNGPVHTIWLSSDEDEP